MSTTGSGLFSNWAWKNMPANETIDLGNGLAAAVYGQASSSGLAVVISGIIVWHVAGMVTAEDARKAAFEFRGREGRAKFFTKAIEVLEEVAGLSAEAVNRQLRVTSAIKDALAACAVAAALESASEPDARKVES